MQRWSVARQHSQTLSARPASFVMPGATAYLPSAWTHGGVGTALAAHDLHVHSAWQDFLRSSVGARAVVVVLPDLTTPTWDALVAFRQSRPLFPILLITAYCRENARRLSGILVEAVLFIDEVPTQLGRALDGLALASPLAKAADAIRALPHLDAELAEALGRACTRTPPLRHVAELAAMLGYDRTTLTRRWSQFIAPPSHPHLFIDWLLVTHALILRSRESRSWACHARELGVTDRTLHDAARRAFGRKLKQLVPLKTRDILFALTKILDAGSANCASGLEARNKDTGIRHFHSASAGQRC